MFRNEIDSALAVLENPFLMCIYLFKLICTIVFNIFPCIIIRINIYNNIISPGSFSAVLTYCVSCYQISAYILKSTF